ncbi:unnamed protein product, partial [Trichogramma brassicae]
SEEYSLTIKRRYTKYTASFNTRLPPGGKTCRGTMPNIKDKKNFVWLMNSRVSGIADDTINTARDAVIPSGIRYTVDLLQLRSPLGCFEFFGDKSFNNCSAMRATLKLTLRLCIAVDLACGLRAYYLLKRAVQLQVSYELLRCARITSCIVSCFSVYNVSARSLHPHLFVFYSKLILFALVSGNLQEKESLHRFRARWEHRKAEALRIAHSYTCGCSKHRRFATRPSDSRPLRQLDDIFFQLRFYGNINSLARPAESEIRRGNDFYPAYGSCLIVTSRVWRGLHLTSHAFSARQSCSATACRDPEFFVVPPQITIVFQPTFIALRKIGIDLALGRAQYSKVGRRLGACFRSRHCGARACNRFESAQVLAQHPHTQRVNTKLTQKYKNTGLNPSHLINDGRIKYDGKNNRPRCFACFTPTRCPHRHIPLLLNRCSSLISLLLSSRSYPSQTHILLNNTRRGRLCSGYFKGECVKQITMSVYTASHIIDGSTLSRQFALNFARAQDTRREERKKGGQNTFDPCGRERKSRAGRTEERDCICGIYWAGLLPSSSSARAVQIFLTGILANDNSTLDGSLEVTDSLNYEADQLNQKKKFFDHHPNYGLAHIQIYKYTRGKQEEDRRRYSTYTARRKRMGG